MKNSKKKALAATALVVLSNVPSTQPNPSGAASAALSSVIERHDLSDVARGHVETLFGDLGPLFERLPMQLVDVIVCGDTIEFVFPDDNRVKLPEQERPVFDAKKGGLKTVEIDGAKLRIGSRLCFRMVQGGFEIRKGDVEVKKCIFWVDLAIHTETRPSQVVCDDEGRPFVKLDAAGNPQQDELGRYRYLETSRWLVLEAKGRRVESALPLSI